MYLLDTHKFDIFSMRFASYEFEQVLLPFPALCSVVNAVKTRQAQCFNFVNEINNMNKLSTIRGMWQLIQKSSRGIKLVIIAGLCAARNNLGLIVYLKSIQSFLLMRTIPLLFRLTLCPDQGIHFPASFTSKCVHVTKVWPMWC